MKYLDNLKKLERFLSLVKRIKNKGLLFVKIFLKDYRKKILLCLRKFELSTMVDGGVSFFWTTNIIFVEGNMNDFAYGQTLLFYKEDMEDIKQRNNANLILEQDGASYHKTKSNIALLNDLFGKEGWIQNPPNSPDLAYQIEDLWEIIKPRVKTRNPQSVQELKKFIIEEWNSILQALIKNLCSGFIGLAKKDLELNDSRLEPEHLKKIKRRIL